ncbi:hypothetical protein BDI4_840039 [Burkholderia diffusa]|nr:hypothetical protein BDI4_840039 [Burkholderia diffusa]
MPPNGARILSFTALPKSDIAARFGFIPFPYRTGTRPSSPHDVARRRRIPGAGRRAGPGQR